MSDARSNLHHHGIDIYESKHSDGYRVNEHCHRFYQVLYALDGEGKIKLDGTVYPIRQDHGVVIAPFSDHAVFSDSKLTLLVLAFRRDGLDSRLLPERSRLLDPSGFSRSELRQLLRKLIFEQSLGQPLSFLAMKICLAEVLLLFARAGQASPSPNANSLRAEKLRAYIDTHYYEIIDSKDLSARLGLSTRHIDHIFKERYQVTPVQYLAQVRIELAQKMLSEADKDIASICFEVGYESLSAFYRTFKKITGISPNTYRKTHALAAAPAD